MSVPPIQPPAIDLSSEDDSPQAKGCAVFCKSNCCSTQNGDDSQRQCFHVRNTDDKVCCVAKDCCIIL